MTAQEFLIQYIQWAPEWWCAGVLSTVALAWGAAAFFCSLYLAVEVILPCLKWVGNSIVWCLRTVFNPHAWAWMFIGLCVVSFRTMGGGTITIREDWWKK